MARIISFDILEITKSLKSLEDLFRSSLKWLETSLHAGIPSQSNRAHLTDDH